MKKIWPVIATLVSVVGSVGFLGYAVNTQQLYDDQIKGGVALPDPRVYSSIFFERGTYYVLIVLVLLWLTQLIVVMRAREFSLKAFVTRHWPEFLAALLITVMCFWTVPPRFRVLSDEANLVSVSQNMLYEKTVLNNVMSKFYYGNLQPIVSEQHLEKRPFLFPFFVHLLHIVRGYDVSNAFLANAFALFALLAMIGVIAQRFIGRMVGFSAMLLVATYPLVCLCATSAGFDLFAAFVLCGVLVTTAVFLHKPSADTFALVWITAVLFAHTRYESALVFFVVILALAVLGFVEAEYFKPYWYHFALTPWLVMPLILQRQLLGEQFENTTGTPNFSFGHFWDHTKEMLGTLIDFGHTVPYATLLNYVAIVSFVGVVIGVFKNIKASWQRPFFAIALVATCALLVLYMSYYFGTGIHPASARFFVYFTVLAALMPVAFHFFYPNILSRNVLLAIALLSAIMYHPISIENRFTNTATLIRETEAEYDFLSKIKDKHILVISERSVDFVALGYGSVDFKYANRNYGEIISEYNRGLYSIVVFQRVNIEKQWPVPDCQFLVPFDLKIAKELQFDANEIVRISWVGGRTP